MENTLTNQGYIEHNVVTVPKLVVMSAAHFSSGFYCHNCQCHQKSYRANFLFTANSYNTGWHSSYMQQDKTVDLNS